MQPITSPHDRFFKEVFSRPELAGDLLRQVLPAETIALFDLTTLRPQKDSFIDPDLQLQYADLLYSVTLASQRPAWVYLLFEHKSYVQPLMAYDMLRYMVRVWEAGQRLKHPTPLAPILPIVVYHGPDTWGEPLDMGALFPGPVDMRRHWPSFDYQLVDLSQLPQDVAAGMLRLQAALWALRNSHHDDVVEHLDELVTLLAELTLEYGAVQYSITILLYISSVHKDVNAVTIRRALRSALIDAEEELMATWLDERYEEGKLEGVKEGRAEEARRLTLSFLQYRFGPLDAALVARVNRLELDQLEALTTAIFEARQLDDIKAMLDR